MSYVWEFEPSFHRRKYYSAVAAIVYSYSICQIEYEYSAVGAILYDELLTIYRTW